MWLGAKLSPEPLLRLLPFPSPNSLQSKVSTVSTTKMRNFQSSIICSDSTTSTAFTSSTSSMSVNKPPRVLKKRKRYRKLYPGESTGITEEMRFVAMKLRNINGKKCSDNENSTDGADNSNSLETSNGEDDSVIETWQPSMEGFLKYLVDSKLIFTTVERIVDESSDVSYAHFRKNGLERSESLSKDLESFSQQGFTIPDPSSPGLSYAKYLEQLAEKNARLFLCHLYNIYFSHIAGGQVIASKVSEKLLEGKELEFFRWEGDASELLKGIREKLNMLSEHWIRDEKNKCLKEAAKSFRYLGQIVRLIIL